MKIWIAAALLWTLGGGVGGIGLLSAQEATRSVWDGVYTEEQAGRGKPLYNQHCASCHADTLMGGEMSPPAGAAAIFCPIGTAARWANCSSASAQPCLRTKRAN